MRVARLNLARCYEPRGSVLWPQRGEATFETVIWPPLDGIVVTATIVLQPTRDPWSGGDG
jgi:hypothetical protein